MSPDSQSDSRRKDILAPRMIIQHQAAFSYDPPRVKMGKSQMEGVLLELQLASSFASFSVLHQEITALVLKTIGHGFTNPDMQDVGTSEHPSGEESLIKGIITKNPHPNDLEGSRYTEPSLSLLNVPDQFWEYKKERQSPSINEGKVLGSYIHEVLLLQGCQSLWFDDHIWMLQKILNTREPNCLNDFLKALMIYMVIACFQKLYQRTWHDRSEPFL
ncbi:hypothetical protein GALMADRAFT_133952 [Galerina marginata CBS 339.88]|uniref:Uncharacterized protein n=1 Tax=Galerina marginata (strain CBS 339.88) TaxID=685588 RepID=A0A067TTJ4_GALM3|nr:hypothetical protein GALMADRAFT_133952 [Galerina marginata CBS 339.88]